MFGLCVNKDRVRAQRAMDTRRAIMGAIDSNAGAQLMVDGGVPADLVAEWQALEQMKAK